MNPTCFFLLFSVAVRKFKMTFAACVDGAEPDDWPLRSYRMGQGDPSHGGFGVDLPRSPMTGSSRAHLDHLCAPDGDNSGIISAEYADCQDIGAHAATGQRGGKEAAAVLPYPVGSGRCTGGRELGQCGLRAFPRQGGELTGKGPNTVIDQTVFEMVSRGVKAG